MRHAEPDRLRPRRKHLHELRTPGAEESEANGMNPYRVVERKSRKGNFEFSHALLDPDDEVLHCATFAHQLELKAAELQAFDLGFLYGEAYASQKVKNDEKEKTQTTDSYEASVASGSASSGRRRGAQQT